MHVRVRPSAAAVYGALLAHTLVSAGNYLFAKRALMEIPALPSRAAPSSATSSARRRDRLGRLHGGRT